MKRMAVICGILIITIVIVLCVDLYAYSKFYEQYLDRAAKGYIEEMLLGMGRISMSRQESAHQFNHSPGSDAYWGHVEFIAARFHQAVMDDTVNELADLLRDTVKDDL